MLRRLFVVMVLAVAGSACSSAPAAPVAAPPTTLPTAISVAPTLPATAVPPPSAIPPTAVPTAIPVAPTTPAAPTPTTQEIAARVDTLMNKLTKQGITSGSILIARDGMVLMKKGYGLADRDKQIPNTPQTQFRITYITNPFTALATLQLQQQGKLKVQDRICTYLANCPAAWDAITIHHLLTQTSGLPDLPESLPATITAAQLIAQFSSTPLEFTPGAQWSRSDTGYTLLSSIIAQVAGMPYEQFVREQILTPASLTNTDFTADPALLATGYKNPLHQADNAGAAVRGAIGLVSTVEDLYRWDQALYTEQLVAKDVRDKMYTASVSIENDPIDGKIGYGYGWFTLAPFDHRDVSHGGRGYGFRALIDRYLDDRVTVIFLSNQEDLDITTLSHELGRIVFGLP